MKASLFTIFFISLLGLNYVNATETIEYKGEAYFVMLPLDTTEQQTWIFTDQENEDGKWIQFYNNPQKTLAKIFQVKDKKFVGQYYKYYANGQLLEKSNYVNGELQGLYTTFYQNGQMKDSCDYQIQKSWEEGNKIGISKTWYENGQVKTVQNFDKKE